MFKIVDESIISLEDFSTWSGATETKNRIIDEDKVAEFDNLIADCYPEGLSSTELNDLLWFEEDWIYEQLGITDEEEDDDSEEDGDDENSTGGISEDVDSGVLE